MADIKAKRLRFTKNGVSHIFEGGGSSDGIMAEGNVRGVRAKVTPFSTIAGWSYPTFEYMDGDETMFGADKKKFIAPETGIYLMSARPFANGDTQSLECGVSIFKGNAYSSNDVTMSFNHKASTTMTGAAPTATAVVKLEKGECLQVAVVAKSAKSIVAGAEASVEFYQISERTDGLVAEAKYEPKANWPVAWVNTTYASSTDTNVIALDGTITLPEDGRYLLSWDSLMPTNYASHVSHTGLSKTQGGDAVIDWIWYEQTPSSAFHILSGVQVISGKKGDRFWLKNYQANAQNSKTFSDEHKTHGIRLFKMSLAGGGGGSATAEPSSDPNNAIGFGSDNKLFAEDLKPEIEQLKLMKFPRATIVGSPTINNGQISGFSSNDYLRFPYIVAFEGRPFIINTEFTTGNDVATQQNIFDSDFGFAFAVRNSKFVIAMSTNGTTWDLGESVGTYTVKTNTTYKVRLSWDGSTYKVEYSIDGGESYVTDISKASTASLYPTQIYIGVGINHGAVLNFFKGSLNFNECNLIISDELVWKGMGNPIDSEMSDTSENSVQNKVIKKYVDDYAGKLDVVDDAANDTLIFKGARGRQVELTAEHLTGETYNGKPVYEKLLIFNNVTGSETYVSVGVSIKEYLYVGGVLDDLTYPGSGKTIPDARHDEVGYQCGISYFTNEWASNPNSLRIELGSKILGRKHIAKIKIKYTKTTD